MTHKERISEDISLSICNMGENRHYVIFDDLYDSSVMMTEDEAHRLIDVLLRVCGDGCD